MHVSPHRLPIHLASQALLPSDDSSQVRKDELPRQDEQDNLLPRDEVLERPTDQLSSQGQPLLDDSLDQPVYPPVASERPLLPSDKDAPPEGGDPAYPPPVHFPTPLSRTTIEP